MGGCAMWLLAAAAVVLLWLMWPDTEELRLRLEQLEEENRRLRSAQSERGDDSSVMWVSALAVAGGVVFTVLVGAAFVGQVQTERDHLKTRLEKLETRRQGTGAFPISRSRAHTHRRHGHPLQTVPSAGLIERPQEKNRVDALR